MAALSEVFAQFAQPGTTVTYLLPSGSKAQAQALSLPSGNCKFSLQYAQDPASVKVSPHVTLAVHLQVPQVLMCCHHQHLVSASSLWAWSCNRTLPAAANCWLSSDSP